MIQQTVLDPDKLRVQLDGTTAATVGGYETVEIFGTANADKLTLTAVLRGTIDTGAGNDTVTVATGTAASTDLLILTAGAGSDNVTYRSAGQGQNVIDLGAGSDTINMAGGGFATISAGGDNDHAIVAFDGCYTLDGGAGTDSIIIGAAIKNLLLNRTASGGVLLIMANDPTLWIQLDNFERIRFSDGNLLTAEQLYARAAPVIEAARESGAVQNTITGTAAAETLSGTASNDMFFGGGDSDTFIGGAGDDRYYVAKSQKIVEKAGEGVDTAVYIFSDTVILPDNVENVVFLNDSNRALDGAHMAYLGYNGGASAIGNALNNWMVGSDADNTLDGRAGDDVLTGGAGANTFVFGKGYGGDLVLDFTPGVDQIRLVSGPKDWAAASLALTDTAAGAVLRLSDGSTLTLTGVAKAQLSARDFQLPVDLSKYHQTFADEFGSFARFDGRTGADGGTWRTRMSSGDGTSFSSGTQQAFVDTNYQGLGLNPFSVSDGVLSITATWRPDLADALGGREFISGAITTEGSFAQQYGYFEARMKLPAQTGGWPAFWLLPTDRSWPIEIDILEQLGRDAGTAYQMGAAIPVDTTQWHTYGLEWTADHLAWYIDGVLTYYVATTAFNKPMYLVLNYALGGSWAGNTTEPATAGLDVGSVQIDYVRVYAPDDGTAPAATVAAGAPDVTFSQGKLAPGDTPAETGLWHYLADTSGPLTISSTDLNLTTSANRYAVQVNNDRQADSYSAAAINGWAEPNVQLRDDDGGTFTVDAFAMAELHAGGVKASSVTLTRVQSGLVETATGDDTITLSSHQIWAWGRSTTIEVRSGAGDDTIQGWTQSTGRLEVHAGSGTDSIIGSGAADLIDGGVGDDCAAGGGGADIFLFVEGEAGTDTVLDFAPGDVLRFQGYSQADLRLIDTASGVQVWLPGQIVVLSAVQAADLGDWAFSFT